jgi:hypothetical protein
MSTRENLSATARGPVLTLLEKGGRATAALRAADVDFIRLILEKVADEAWPEHERRLLLHGVERLVGYPLLDLPRLTSVQEDGFCGLFAAEAQHDDRYWDAIEVRFTPPIEGTPEQRLVRLRPGILGIPSLPLQLTVAAAERLPGMAELRCPSLSLDFRAAVQRLSVRWPRFLQYEIKKRLLHYHALPNRRDLSPLEEALRDAVAILARDIKAAVASRQCDLLEGQLAAARALTAIAERLSWTVTEPAHTLRFPTDQAPPEVFPTAYLPDLQDRQGLGVTGVRVLFVPPLPDRVTEAIAMLLQRPQADLRNAVVWPRERRADLVAQLSRALQDHRLKDPPRAEHLYTQDILFRLALCLDLDPRPTPEGPYLLQDKAHDHERPPGDTVCAIGTPFLLDARPVPALRICRSLGPLPRLFELFHVFERLDLSTQLLAPLCTPSFQEALASHSTHDALQERWCLPLYALFREAFAPRFAHFWEDQQHFLGELAAELRRYGAETCGPGSAALPFERLLARDATVTGGLLDFRRSPHPPVGEVPEVAFQGIGVRFPNGMTVKAAVTVALEVPRWFRVVEERVFQPLPELRERHVGILEVVFDEDAAARAVVRLHVELQELGHHEQACALEAAFDELDLSALPWLEGVPPSEHSPPLRFCEATVKDPATLADNHGCAYYRVVRWSVDSSAARGTPISSCAPAYLRRGRLLASGEVMASAGLDQGLRMALQLAGRQTYDQAALRGAPLRDIELGPLLVGALRNLWLEDQTPTILKHTEKLTLHLERRGYQVRVDYSREELWEPISYCYIEGLPEAREQVVLCPILDPDGACVLQGRRLRLRPGAPPAALPMLKRLHDEHRRAHRADEAEALELALRELPDAPEVHRLPAHIQPETSDLLRLLDLAHLRNGEAVLAGRPPTPLLDRLAEILRAILELRRFTFDVLPKRMGADDRGRRAPRQVGVEHGTVLRWLRPGYCFQPDHEGRAAHRTGTPIVAG